MLFLNFCILLNYLAIYIETQLRVPVDLWGERVEWGDSGWRLLKKHKYNVNSAVIE